MFTPSADSRSQYVIGLAGHIDHGKSCLVHALTGGTVDRLPEERRRGITIDLGFSHFDAAGCRFALIDVPGHERFIHTMVVGASGIDLALLVVAADDSVMPQTREHLAVLELLGIRLGVVAVTKCDLVDEEQLGLVDLEIDELTANSFLAQAPRVRVSAHTGLGIEPLRQQLIAMSRASPLRPTSDPRFRLPIDRVFSPAGQGTVVTGTVWRGAARVGDTLHLLPAAAPVRIRRLQTQGRDVEQVSAGQRAAINLAGVKVADVRRGNELATPLAFESAQRQLVQLRVLPEATAGLRHRQFVRIHLGANQATAQLLLNERQVAPRQTAFAVLRCKTPIVAEYGQPFIIRQLSPAALLGGGTILTPALRPSDKMKHCLASAADLASADPLVRLPAFVGLLREVTFGPSIASWIGLDPDQCALVAARLVEQGQLVRTSTTLLQFVTAARLAELTQQLLHRLRIELGRRQPASVVPLSAVLAPLARSTSSSVLETLLDRMTARREIVRRQDKVGLPSGAELSHRQRQIVDGLIAACVQAGATPPTLKEFAERSGCQLKDLEPLVQVAVDQGWLVRLTSTMVIDPAAIETLRQHLAEHLRSHTTFTVSQLRERWGMTRKHAVPIFEFFDQCQITTRVGDLRSAGPRVALPVAQAIT